jgi:hypothetical protein
VPRKCNISYTLIKYTASCKTDKDKRDRGLIDFMEKSGYMGFLGEAMWFLVLVII